MNKIASFLQDNWMFVKYTVHGFLQPYPPKNWEQVQSDNNLCPAVLLIPGYSENWHFLKSVGKSLHQSGCQVIFPQSFGPIKPVLQTATEIDLEMKRRFPNLKNIVIVAHSKGGLVAKLLLSRFNDTNTYQKLITSATPWGGTWAGNIGILNLGELKSGSDLLKELATDIEANKRIVNCVPAGYLDQYISPESLNLPGAAKQVEMDLAWHGNMLYSQKFVEAVLDELRVSSNQII